MKQRRQSNQNQSDPLQGMEDAITYKNISLLEKYISTRGRIMPSSRTGVSQKNQRKLSRAIKRARQLALLPYARYV